MDLVGSVLGLILLSPLLLAIAVYIKLVSPGPVLFKQKRVGRWGKEFTMLKFRSLKVNADTNGHQEHVGGLLNSEQPIEKLDDDPWIIPFGNILRKCYLDELPQLVNVSRGEMSLVGPRPFPLYEVRGYQPWYGARHDVAPGMTGLWQVNRRKKMTYREMMRLDIAYARGTSLWLDLKILLRTIPVIVAQVKDSLSKRNGEGAVLKRGAHRP